ncbi:hypothetical protein MPC4_340020 [Methylocella tundrae]|uniref:FAD-binding domain-containing protein n=1 Tax=Methylocella tundrae TaxID=227605 RepID=A0A8B6M8R4_METTU|nr:hypothetical protein MPC4_340020 [Methylocella tundrae]
MQISDHPVVVVGGGPSGLMLAGELALAGVDVAIVERRPSQDVASSRAGGLHSRTIEVFDQRGIADRFLAERQKAQATGFAGVHFDLSGFPTRHPYRLCRTAGQAIARLGFRLVAREAARRARRHRRCPGASAGPTSTIEALRGR